MGDIMSDEKRKNQNYDQEMLKCAARAIASTKGVSRVKNKTVQNKIHGNVRKLVRIQQNRKHMVKR